jgi:hypothetical protein
MEERVILQAFGLGALEESLRARGKAFELGCIKRMPHAEEESLSYH